MSNFNQSVTMICNDLEHIPVFDLPSGYELRTYQPGDAHIWVAVQAAAERYETITLALFQKEFGPDEVQLAARQFFLCDEQHLPIGTATAWFDDDFGGQAYGRVHWVAITPPFQGQGLAKPLLSAVCYRLRKLGHQRVYLDTSSARIPAINLYWKFGFRPYIQSTEDATLWQSLSAQLKEKI